MYITFNFANINIRMGLEVLKSTGVVRRIDELGRIVIPKEIRRNLGIRDGENVEIFTENDSIILKKYNRLTSSADLAKTLCEIIDKDLKIKTIITNRETVIATNGLTEVLIDKKISSEIEKMLEKRETETKMNYTLKLEDIELVGNFLFIPIISLNDCIGFVIMYSTTNFTIEESIGKLIASIFTHKLEI